MFILNKLLPMLYYYFRPLIKWFLHTFTQLCEVQRICYGTTSGARRSVQVERSLELTRNKNIQNIIVEFDDEIDSCNDEEFNFQVRRVVAGIMREKKIKIQSHPDFPAQFDQCITQIWGYKRLVCEVERLRAEVYDTDNPAHESKLIMLWEKLMPEVKLSARATKQWQDIGFQGDDPKTDFRGMGLLGLDNLLYFATEYNIAARHALRHSMHPNLGYTFAIVGINLTWMAYRMLKSGAAKNHFYNVTPLAATMDDFHKFYCYLFFEFDRYWMYAEPRNIMDFSMIHQSFEAEVLLALEDDEIILKSNFVLEDV